MTGVPQGSVLSPLLYNVFLSDLPRPEDGGVKQLSNADDVVVFAKGIHMKGMEVKLNLHLESVCRYYLFWGLKAPARKTAEQTQLLTSMMKI